MQEIKLKQGTVKVDDDIYARLLTLRALVFKHHDRYYVKYVENNVTKEVALTSFISGTSGRTLNAGFKDGACENCIRDNLIFSNKAVKKSKAKKYYGVNKNGVRYQARISKDNSRINVIVVGTYLDEITAAIAYNKAMDKVYGKGKYLENRPNIPQDAYDRIYKAVSVDVVERTSRQGTNQKLSGATSIYTGVCKAIDNGEWRGKWTATLYYKSKNVYLGRFASELIAAQAYNEVALCLYGKDAKVNAVPKPLHPVIDIKKILLKINMN